MGTCIDVCRVHGWVDGCVLCRCGYVRFKLRYLSTFPIRLRANAAAHSRALGAHHIFFLLQLVIVRGRMMILKLITSFIPYQERFLIVRRDEFGLIQMA